MYLYNHDICTHVVHYVFITGNKMGYPLGVGFYINIRYHLECSSITCLYAVLGYALLTHTHWLSIFSPSLSFVTHYSFAHFRRHVESSTTVVRTYTAEIKVLCTLCLSSAIDYRQSRAFPSCTLKRIHQPWMCWESICLFIWILCRHFHECDIGNVYDLNDMLTRNKRYRNHAYAITARLSSV